MKRTFTMPACAYPACLLMHGHHEPVETPDHCHQHPLPPCGSGASHAAGGEHSHEPSVHHHDHEHDHPHTHHEHGHDHPHTHHEQREEPAGQAVLPNKAAQGEPILTVRAFSGLSGDMLLTGLALMNGLSWEEVARLPLELGMAQFDHCVQLEQASVNGIAGFRSTVTLPREHAHRTLKDILPLIEKTALSALAKERAASTFVLLAEAEGHVHGYKPEDVTFHEVGALDSILDICLVCELFTRLNPVEFRVSPLPMADGGVWCAHGLIPTPAPAVFALLENVQVQGFSGQGETVTPTAIALLKTLGARFGTWPAMTIERKALVYGGKVFAGAPNGALWAWGPGL